jgi:PPOX class probable F420-dependent enzyme
VTVGVNQRADIVLTEEEIKQFLAGSRSMTLASVGQHGQPHLVAMWFALIDGDVCFETKSKSQKAVNLRRNPRVSCLVEDGSVYEDLRGVAIEGVAQVSDDASLLWQIGVNLFERYYAPYTDDLKPFVDAMLNNRVAVRVKGERVRSWDHRKLNLPSTGEPGGSTMSVAGRRAR